MHLVGRIRNRVRRATLRLTGRPVRRLLSIDVGSAPEFAKRYAGVAVHTLKESAGTTTLLAKHLPQDDIPMLRPFKQECETVLLDVINPNFSFSNLVMHDPDLNVIFAEGFPQDSILSLRRYAPRKCRTVEGTVAYLSNTGVDNYYHWLHLTLPLLRLYRLLAPQIAIDYYYVGETGSRQLQNETLAHFGIVPEQILREPCRADRLLAAFPLHRPQHGTRFRDPWGHAFVRSNLNIGTDAASPRRIYVKRGKARARKCLNEEEIIGFLSRFGFEAFAMEGRRWQEQARLFANAEIIVAPHGAALANLLFATEGAKLIEMFPQDYSEASFFTAATHAKLDYYYLVGEPVKPSSRDLRVDLGKLEQLMENAGIGASEASGAAGRR